ncbi:hypothetical protein [Burkholderia pseudomallei]|uniref:hypothetical protein n=1 Tax=Burkholderia pseudomallei TaxID=28450 RepID=UPI00193D4E99|nr:hypothetical protein [Burkholderia pseudomallei]QRM23555.1 hypothetical protein JQX71_04520 [Burkholderia pseudomallei]
MNYEHITSYDEFCAAAHDELAAIARENIGRGRKGDGFWDDVADASATGILLSLGKAVRLPDVEEFPGVPQIDYETIPARDNRIGRDILDRVGPFKFETNTEVAAAQRAAGQPVNFAISPAGLAVIREKVRDLIRIAKWRFFTEQQQMLAA